MTKLKLFISLLIIFIVGVGVTVGYMLTNITHEEYEALATVFERRSASELIVKLNNEPEIKLENDLIVYSNIFKINDKLKIKYTKKGRSYVITHVDALTETNEEKANLVSKMISDPTIIKYAKLASVKLSGDTTFSQSILALPVKLANQEFNFMTEKEYFGNYYEKFDITFLPFPKDTEIILSLLKDFKVISVENIVEEKRVNIPYTFTKKTVTFKSSETGIYSVKLDFKNGDIINYVFLG